MEIALKVSAGSFNAIQLTFLRFLIGGLLLLPLAIREIRRKKSVFRRGDLAFFLLSGFLCVNVSMILFQMAVLYSPASVTAVLFSCNSVFAVLFARLLLGERIGVRTVVSILVIVAGMAVIIDPLHGSGSALGMALALGAAVTFALYNIVGRTKSGRWGGITLTCFSFLFGCAELLLLIAAGRIPAAAGWLRGAGLGLFAEVPLAAGVTLQSLPGLLYVGIFVTGLGYTFYFLAMEQTSAATAALVFYIKPVLAPLLALAVLGEAITGRMAAGIALIIAGSLVSFLPAVFPKKAAEDQSAEPEAAEAAGESEEEIS